jgi:hypothetical protein
MLLVATSAIIRQAPVHKKSKNGETPSGKHWRQIVVVIMK